VKNTIKKILNLQLIFSCKMSRKEKLIIRLLSKPRDFRYSELMSLLGSLGYVEFRTGRTSGSRIAFCHGKTKHIIRLHRPHPGDIMKMYQLEMIIEALTKEGLI
jgi:hypothetical protein